MRCRRRVRVRAGGYSSTMQFLGELVLAVLLLLPVVVVGLVFVWAARKDGEADRAVQRRLGIRRKTRLGL